MFLDVAIIGGGPAGAAAALSLKQLAPHARVAIFEAAREDLRRPGETLPPRSDEILKSLGCWPAFLRQGFLECYGTRAAWGAAQPYDNEFIFSLHGNGWRLDRMRFDAMLRSVAGEAGVEIHVGARLRESIRNGAGNWRLQMSGLDCEAGFVIDATGRAASFAILQGSKRSVADQLAGAFVFFDFPQSAAPEDSYTLIEAQEDGWWYSSISPGSIAVAAWMSDGDLIRGSHLNRAENWSGKLAASTHTRERLRNARPKSAPAIHSAQSQRLDRIAGPGWAAAGDAAMTFDPLSSQGILKALRSGKLASFSAFDHLQGREPSHARYEKVGIAEYDAYETTKREYYLLEQRWPESPFWKRRHGG